MSNSYYDATGVLSLSTVTPVITALFGAYNLNQRGMEPGEAYIARIAEDNYPTWSDMQEGLEGLAQELGLSLAPDTEPTIRAYLHMLAAHFNVADDSAMQTLIDDEKFVEFFDDGSDLDTLFQLAVRLDDGHGLTSIKMEGCWHSDKALLCGFGGDGEYISRNICYYAQSTEVTDIGAGIDDALSKNNLDDAAECVFTKVNEILNSIADEGVRTALVPKLMDLMQKKYPATSTHA